MDNTIPPEITEMGIPITTETDPMVSNMRPLTTCYTKDEHPLLVKAVKELVNGGVECALVYCGSGAYAIWRTAKGYKASKGEDSE